jgi:pimeloyl-ACP methyl ester carboxylesterase
LVSKLILVSSPAFTESYVAQLHARRLSRLDERQRTEFQALITGLENCGTTDKDALLAKLGALVAKSDKYAHIEDADEPGTLNVNVDGEIYQRVWTEAAEMRRSGELLRRVRDVRCPVVAIHGDHDPSPADGVSEPLSGVLRDFRFVLLPRCGHTPWNERFAREEFYRVLNSEI